MLKTNAFSKNIILFSILALGIALSMLASSLHYEFHYNTIHEELDYQLSEWVSRVEDKLLTSQSIMESIQAFFYASEKVTRSEFSSFTRMLLQKTVSIQALEWIPHITGRQRTRFEAAVREEGFDSFQITEFTNKRITRATDRSDYYPVDYIEPYTGNETAHGYDIASNNKRLLALENVRESGKGIATERISLVQDEIEESAFLLIYPIFDYANSPSTNANTSMKLTGYIAGVFRVSRLIETIPLGLKKSDIALTIRDTTAVPSTELYKNDFALSDFQPVTFPSHSFSFGSRIWEFTFKVSPQYFSKKINKDHMLIFIYGIIITLLCLLYASTQLKYNREKQDRLHSVKMIVDNLDSVVYVSDLETHVIIFMNAFGKNIFPDKMDSHCLDLFDPKQSNEYKDFMATALLDKSNTPVDVQICEFINTTDNQWYEHRNRAIPWIDGRYVRLAIVTNIQKRKEAEVALRESEERLRSAYDAANNVAFITTDLGGTNTKIVTFSPGAENIFGYDGDEIIGKNIALLHTQEDTRKFPEMQAILVNTGKGFSGETELVRKNGDHFPALFSLQPIQDASHSVIGTLGVSLDISDLKKKEAELQNLKDNLQDEVHRKTEELRDAHKKLLISERLATIGQLGGSVAHEFRNQLGVIKNVSHFLHLRLGDSDPVILRHLTILNDQVMSTNRIIENILSFSKAKEPTLAPVALRALLETSVRTATHNKIDDFNIVYDIDQDVPDIINIDETQMRQVFNNIIGNAAEAMEEEGTLTVTARIINGALHLSFHDTGSGIDEHDKPHLFEPLFTTKSSGSGFGLSTVKLLIEKHKGTIAIDSEIGSGTTVTILLPLLEIPK